MCINRCHCCYFCFSVVFVGNAIVGDGIVDTRLQRIFTELIQNRIQSNGNLDIKFSPVFFFSIDSCSFDSISLRRRSRQYFAHFVIVSIVHFENVEGQTHTVDQKRPKKSRQKNKQMPWICHDFRIEFTDFSLHSASNVVCVNFVPIFNREKYVQLLSLLAHSTLIFDETRQMRRYIFNVIFQSLTLSRARTHISQSFWVPFKFIHCFGRLFIFVFRFGFDFRTRSAQSIDFGFRLILFIAVWRT